MKVTQEHTGLGDNVGEKHIHNAISPAAIQTPIEEVLTCLRHRNHTSARNKLETLESTSQLSTEAKAVLNLITLLVQLANDSNITQGYSVVDACIRAIQGTFFEDIATSARLRLDIHGERSKDAENHYQSIETPGEYSKEVYYEYLAKESELENILKHDSHQLTEITLCGLSRGFIRCQSHSNALSSCETLLVKYPSFNSRVVNFIAQCNHLANQLTAHYYWLITASEKKRVLSLVDECIHLLEECEANDSRVVNQALRFLQFLIDSYEPLVDVCWKFINNIESIDIDFGHSLRRIRDSSFEELIDLSDEIEKANKDPLYKNSILERLNNSRELSSSEDLILFGNVADSETIKKWIDNGGKISFENELEKHFNQLELLCYANDGSPKSIATLTKAAESLISITKKDPCSLNPVRLRELTAMLLEAGLAPQTSTLLEPIIPKADIWLSPIVKIYINALLESQQLATLNNILSEINPNDWCEFLWQVKARLLDLLNELDEAILAIKKALELSPKSLAIWDYLVYLLKRNGTNIDTYREYLNKIPAEIFAQPNDQSLRLLLELSANGYFDVVENTIVNWFIVDPINSATPITNFHVNELTINESIGTRSVMDSTKNSVGGFRYIIDGKDSTKLLVHDCEPTHASIIKDSSPLAQQLLRMSINETVQYGVYDLTLLEKLPPYIAVHRLSLEIRHTTNDGSDCFYQFSLPENPDEMISSIERKMIALQSNDKQEEFYKNPAYPLFLKGHLLDKDCPVQSALYHLTSKASVKHSLPNIGVELPDTMILDVYSVAYLALTGLVHGLENTQTEILITVETQAYLEHFLKNVSRNDYMQTGINEEGKLYVITADMIKKDTKNVREGIEHILKIASIGHPHLADIPPDIIKIKEGIDLSVFSSLKLSITNNIPWFCIDDAFAKLAQKSNYPTVNAFVFLSSLSNNLDINSKLPGIYLHVSAGLPFPITYEDLLEMSNANDVLSHYFLSKILRMYPNVYTNSDLAIQHLHKIVLLGLAKAYDDGVFLNGFSSTNMANNGYAERLFYTCCYITIQIRDGEEAERKLAKLLCTVVNTAKGNPVICQLVRHLSSRFISGHFLSFDAVNQNITDLLHTK